jgi:lipopolysaccharide transport system ATP-binding protein
MLEDGRLVATGKPADVVREYMERRSTTIGRTEGRHRSGTGEWRFASVAAVSDVFTCAEPKVIRMVLSQRSSTIDRLFVSVEITDSSGIVVAHCDSRACDTPWLHSDSSDDIAVELSLVRPWLKPGRYTVTAYACNSGVLDAWSDCCAFEVTEPYPFPIAVSAEAVASSSVLSEFSYELRDRVATEREW